MADLAKKTEKDLLKDLGAKRKDIREFRFNTSGSKLTNVKEVSTAKKDIARILTELNARKAKM